MEHNQISFAKEYCRCKKIPYEIEDTKLTIKDGKHRVSLISLFLFTYEDILKEINAVCVYDANGVFNGISEWHKRELI